MNDVTDDAASRRHAVLEAAAALAADEGVHALTLRRVCAVAGGSTQLAYTLFGGKQGLADALWTEAFDRFARQLDGAGLDRAEPGHPERLLMIGRTYRSFAAAEPGFFSIVFDRGSPGFAPTPEVRVAGRAKTFGRALAEAQACLDAGTLVAPDAFMLAAACWVAVHGVTTLEANSIIGSDDALIGAHEVDRFAEHVLRLVVEAHRP